MLLPLFDTGSGAIGASLFFVSELVYRSDLPRHVAFGKRPLAVFKKVFTAGVTDISWSSDGLVLCCVSMDGR